jgi:hypothetical protein
MTMVAKRKGEFGAPYRLVGAAMTFDIADIGQINDAIWPIA